MFYNKAREARRPRVIQAPGGQAHDPVDALACIAAWPLIDVLDVLQYRFPQPATWHAHTSSAGMSTSRRRFLLPLRDVHACVG